MGTHEERMAMLRNAPYFKRSGDSQFTREAINTIDPSSPAHWVQRNAPGAKAGYTCSTAVLAGVSAGVLAAAVAGASG